MGDRDTINRAAWAAKVRQLIDNEAGGNQSEFARKVGTTTRTVARWLNQTVGVSMTNVRAVADALHYGPNDLADLLVEVGYLANNDTRAPLDPDVRRWVAILADPTVSNEKKKIMREQMRLWDRSRTIDRDTPHSAAQ